MCVYGSVYVCIYAYIAYMWAYIWVYMSICAYMNCVYVRICVYMSVYADPLGTDGLEPPMRMELIILNMQLSEYK